MAAVRIPGINPAVNCLPTEVPIAMAICSIGIEGGIITPSVPPVVIMPRLSNRG